MRAIDVLRFRVNVCALLAAGALMMLFVRPMVAAGKVTGHAAVNGKSAVLTYAAATTVEGLFDDTKKDTIVLLADRPVAADVDPGDEVAVSLHARKGEFRALMLRIDDTRKLINVKLFDQGIQGVLMFPGAGFEFVPGTMTAKGAAGRIHTRAPTTFDGTTLECDATFDAPVSSAAPAAPAPVASAPAPDASAALDKLLAKHLTLTADDFLTAVQAQEVDTVKLFLDAGMAPDTKGGAGTPLFAADTPLVWAIMMKNEPMALALIKAGASVKRVDSNGMTPLTWAVESCAPPVVQALVDAKADVNFKRAGMTMLQEAGACPAAAAILKKAGAR